MLGGMATASAYVFLKAISCLSRTGDEGSAFGISKSRYTIQPCFAAHSTGSGEGSAYSLSRLPLGLC